MRDGTVTVSGKRTRVLIVKENIHTVLVKLLTGKIIKRHRRKHGLRLFS